MEYRVERESCRVIGPDGNIICPDLYRADELAASLNRAVEHGRRLEAARLSGLAKDPARVIRRRHKEFRPGRGWI